MTKTEQQITYREGGKHSLSTPRFDRAQIDLIKRTLCLFASDDEFQLFLATARRLQLDPFANQIYMAPRRVRDPENKDQFIVVRRPQITIDGYRSIAVRTGLYCGQTSAQWAGPDLPITWHEAWPFDLPPVAARVGVYRKGWDRPSYGTAHWEEFVQRNADGNSLPVWSRMGCNQLAKCAEAQSLRKTFQYAFEGVPMIGLGDAPAIAFKNGSVAHDPETGEIFDAEDPQEDFAKMAEGLKASLRSAANLQTLTSHRSRCQWLASKDRDLGRDVKAVWDECMAQFSQDGENS